MYVSDLALNDFRSYKTLLTKFPSGTVVLHGRNGRGKTNLVEAIGYLSTFSSHRVNAETALLRRVTEDEDSPSAAVIRARVHKSIGSQLLELEIVKGKANRARLNRGQVKPKDLLGQIRTVIFAPEDLQLLRGDPAGRRRFIDDMLTQLKPNFSLVRRDYERVLRQRSAVLKQLSRAGGFDMTYADDSLAVWDQALANLSAQIVFHRLGLVKAIEPLMVQAYGQVSDNDKISGLKYESKLVDQEKRSLSTNDVLEIGELQLPKIVDGYFVDNQQSVDSVQQLESHYLSMIKHYRQAELKRTVNLVGAHRDDILLSVQGMPVKGYASHGETWSIILALRLAEMRLLAVGTDTPVLILDDVFAELDQGRRQALANSIADVEQVIITAAVIDDIPHSMNAKTFTVVWDQTKGSEVSETDE